MGYSKGEARGIILSALEPNIRKLLTAINNQTVDVSATQPDGDEVTLKADGLFFQTDVSLAADGVYTSDWFDHDGYNTIEIFVKSDVVSANKGIVMEWNKYRQYNSRCL